MKIPTDVTLKKYGLSREEWIALYNKYDGKCHVCLKPSKRLNIEHEHVKGWKNMLPEERKNYIRGLACFVCNYKLLQKGIDLERLENAVRYLKEYEQRKLDLSSPKDSSNDGSSDS
jgi:hypothetical protein